MHGPPAPLRATAALVARSVHEIIDEARGARGMRSSAETWSLGGARRMRQARAPGARRVRQAHAPGACAWRSRPRQAQTALELLQGWLPTDGSWHGFASDGGTGRDDRRKNHQPWTRSIVFLSAI